MMFFSCFLSYEYVKLLLGHIPRMKSRGDLWERFDFICLCYLLVQYDRLCHSPIRKNVNKVCFLFKFACFLDINN